jgi:hypothetical protein
MTMHALISPITFHSSGTATQLHAVAHVSPNRSASVEWTLTTDEGKRVQGGLLTLEGAAYQGWGASDEYLYTWIADMLGITVSQIVDPPPPPPYVPPADPETIQHANGL